MPPQPDKDGLFTNPPSPGPVAGADACEAKNSTLEQPMTIFTPPNGGLLAWLQVAGAFVLFFNSWYAFHNPAVSVIT